MMRNIISGLRRLFQPDTSPMNDLYEAGEPAGDPISVALNAAIAEHESAGEREREHFSVHIAVAISDCLKKLELRVDG